MKQTVLAILVFCFLCGQGAVQAQEYESDTTSLGILLTKEKAFHINIHTLGYGLGYRIGRNISYYKNRMYEIDLIEMKAPNQVKTYNPRIPRSKSYIYGKLNYLYLLRVGYGKQHLVNRKPYWGGVEVRFFYYGGLTAAFERPVNLYIAYYTSIGDIVYYDLKLERYDPKRHFTYVSTAENCDIAGGGPILSGFDKIKIRPGAYTRLGFNFEFSKYNNIIRALEIGVMVDVLPMGTQIMAFKDPSWFFINGYFSFHFGSRYN